MVQGEIGTKTTRRWLYGFIWWKGSQAFFNLSCQYYFCWPRKIRQGVKILVVATFKPAPSTNLNLCVCGYQRAEQFWNIQKDWIWIILIIDSTLLDVSRLSRSLCDQIWRIILEIKAKKTKHILYIVFFRIRLHENKWQEILN